MVLIPDRAVRRVGDIGDFEEVFFDEGVDDGVDEGLLDGVLEGLLETVLSATDGMVGWEWMPRKTKNPAAAAMRTISRIKITAEPRFID
jgi:hypothetical protein